MMKSSGFALLIQTAVDKFYYIFKTEISGIVLDVF